MWINFICRKKCFFFVGKNMVFRLKINIWFLCFYLRNKRFFFVKRNKILIKNKYLVQIKQIVKLSDFYFRSLWAAMALRKALISWLKILKEKQTYFANFLCEHYAYSSFLISHVYSALFGEKRSKNKLKNVK